MSAKDFNIEIVNSLFKLVSSFFHTETPLKSKEANRILEDPEKTKELYSKLKALKEGRSESVEIEVDGKKYVLTVNDNYFISKDDRRPAPQHEKTIEVSTR